MPENIPLPPIKKQFEEFHGFWNGNFDRIRELKVKSGELVLGTEAGGRSHNEDILVLDTDRDGFAVVDGMGGYERGDEAAAIVGMSILDGLKNNLAPQVMQRQAWESMKKAGMRESGAVYVAGQIQGKKLKVWSAGDARLITFDRDGKLKFSTEFTSLSHAPSGRGPGRATEVTFPLMNHDRILAAADGLWDNIDLEDALDKIKYLPLTKALDYLKQTALKNMHAEFGRGQYGNPDNLTILLYQILPVPLRGK